MIITHQFEMAMDRKGVASTIDAVQGDKLTRVVEITLTAGGEAWPVPAGSVGFVRFRKPDRTGGIYDTLEDGTAAITIADNVISAVLAPQVLTAKGRVDAQIEFVNGDSSIATFTFHVNVQEDPSIDTMTSEDYINLSAYVAAEVKRILGESGGSGGSSSYFEIDNETLVLKDGVLSVNVADVVEADNTRPITSAAVHAQLGNIEALLATI